MTNIPTVDQYSKDLQYTWNEAKQRREVWQRCARGNREWVLHDADPAIVFHDGFFTINVVTFEADKILCDHPWGRNGNRADNAGVPNQYNFAACSRQGGGLWIQSGDTTNDWVALHTDYNYPLYLSASPKMQVVGTIWVPNEEVIARIGMFDSHNLETANASPWTVPEDGMWVEYLNYGAVGPIMRFITSFNGVQTVTEFADISSEVFQLNIEVNDDCDKTRLVANGDEIAVHNTRFIHLGFGSMKPLFMIQTNEDVDKSLELYDVKLIEDALEY